MKQPRPTTECLRCGEPYSLHNGNGHESTRSCPWRRGLFRRSIQRPGASQSFTEHEVMVLDQVTRALLRGGDLRNLAKAHTDTLESVLRYIEARRRVEEVTNQHAKVRLRAEVWAHVYAAGVAGLYAGTLRPVDSAAMSPDEVRKCARESADAAAQEFDAYCHKADLK